MTYLKKLLICILFLYCSLQACVEPVSYIRNRSRTILWQAGKDYYSIQKMRCLARQYNISHIQTFRFLELTKNLNKTEHISLSNSTSCARDVYIILYIGPTRDQLKISKDKTFWLNYNYKVYLNNVILYDQLFGLERIILQLYDEPSSLEEIEIINSFCKFNPNQKYFLSTNSRSLSFIDKLKLNCFNLIDFHSYGTSQNYPQIFTHQVNFFLSKLNARYNNLFSITIPLFIKNDKKSKKKEMRIYDPASFNYLISSLKISPSYYGAYLSPNIGFMQDTLLFSYFQNNNISSDNQ